MLNIDRLLSSLAFGCTGILETQKGGFPMKMRKGHLFPQLYTQSCGWMAVPCIVAGCRVFYPGMKNRQESERSHLILLRVTQTHVDQSEDFHQLHSTLLVQTQVQICEIQDTAQTKHVYISQSAHLLTIKEPWLTQDTPVPFPNSEGSRRGLCLLLGVELQWHSVCLKCW